MDLQTLRLGVATVLHRLFVRSAIRTSIRHNGAVDDDPISLGTRGSAAAVNVDRSLAGLASSLALLIS
jgi:hypothetical protein